MQRKKTTRAREEKTPPLKRKRLLHDIEEKKKLSRGLKEATRSLEGTR